MRKDSQRLREAKENLADIRAYDAARPKVLAEVKVGQFSSLAEYRARRSWVNLAGFPFTAPSSPPGRSTGRSRTD